MAGEHDQGAAGAPVDDGADIELVILDGEGDGASAGIEGGAPELPAPEEPDYAALRRQLEDEQRGRAADRARADEATRAVQGAHAREVDANIGRVNSALGEMQAHATKLKSDLAEAYQAGDFAKVAELTEKVGEAGAAQRDLAARKAEWEAYKKNPPQQRQATPTQPADPVEAFAAGRSAPTQAWIRANPDFIRDPKKLQRLQGAHMMAEADHAVDSPGYFEAINATLGIKPAAAAAATTPARRAAPVAAPVSRDAGGITGGTPRAPQSVKLTASEVAMAQQMNIPLKDYAREKIKVAQEVAAGEHRK